MSPSKQTLRRYGLTLEEWMTMYNKYNGGCHICKVKSKRLCVDHYHVRGWKSMLPEKRKLYVRGLLCWTCNNHLLSRGTNLEKLKSAVIYLQQFEKQKPP